METTIDKVGRLVVPKALRAAVEFLDAWYPGRPLTLTAPQVRRTLADVIAAGVHGGQIYDALVARTVTDRPASSDGPLAPTGGSARSSTSWPDVGGAACGAAVRTRRAREPSRALRARLAR